MNELDNLVGAETQAVELSDIVGTPLSFVKPPEGAVRNRAATLSLMADGAEVPEQLSENYQMLMAEGERGDSSYANQLTEQIQRKSVSQDQDAFMSVLSDPSIPFERKQQLIKDMKLNPMLKDTRMKLFTDSLAAPSQDETIEAADARVGSMGAAIAEIYQANQEIQGLVNAHAASLPDASLATVGDMAALWMLPFGNSAAVSRIDRAVNPEQSIWKTIKGFLAPGTKIADIRSQLEALPPQERVEFSKSLLDTISSNSGIVFSTDNQFAEFEKASQIFEQGGYSSTDEWLDNISVLLDVVGIGGVMRASKGAKKVASASTIPQAPALPPVVKSAPTALPEAPARVPNVLPEDLATTTGRPMAGAYDERIRELQAERESYLPMAAEPGKEGAQAVEEINRINRNIELLEKRNTPVYLQKQALSDAISRIESNQFVRREVPVSPHEIVKQTNPQKARSLHEAIMEGDDNVAEALAGTQRTQAIANDVFPQVGTASGKIVAQPTDIQRNLRRKALVPERIQEYIWETGRIDLTPQEKAAVRANVVRDFQQAEGLVMNEAMGSFTIDGGRIKISAVYGTPEGAFVNAGEALEQAKYALRHVGVREDEIEILRREGRDLVPVNLTDATEEGSYMVRVNTFHEIDPTDVVKFENFDVKLNFFDRFSSTNWGSAGSLSRHLVDAASMLDKRLSGAASNVSDQGARLEQMMLEEAKTYSDKYAALSKTEKAQVDSYILEANLNGLAFDPIDLVARGFSMDGVNAVRAWREFWDANYYLENLDMVRTFNAQGYQLFENKNARLFARPVAKNQNNNVVYDPDIDQVVVLPGKDMDDLYNIGGTVAKLRRPESFGGVKAEYMIIRNSPTSYSRKIRDSDTVLNYREGYYSIQYRAPRFVDEVDADGIRRAVAVAGDTREAQHFADRMARNADNGETYVVRSDDRALRKGSDDWFDVNSAGGRIAQRHRGKTLEDSSGMNHLGDGEYILDPVSSAIRAAKSIAGRTVARPVLETAKARFLQQYEKYLPSDGMGGKKFPNSVDEIGIKGESFSSDIADARTTWEYIRYLENGYVNGIDNFYKAFLHFLSEEVGKKGAKWSSKTLSKVERGFDNLADPLMSPILSSPTGAGKNLVFTAYIGTNVLRQWVVQAHQGIRTIFYNPEGWVSGRIPGLWVDYMNHMMGNTTAFGKFMDDSGMMAAVDKQNLVRGTLKDAADHSNAITRVTGKALNVPRQIGFDMGERGNMVMHLSAVYDKYKAAGKNMNDKAVKAEAYAEARALSYDMNFAGDLPYNQNSAGVLLQFMQVPHKALMQATNRRIPGHMRLRMVAADLAFWGGPTWLVSEMMGGDILPDDPELREVFVYGVESWMLNHSFRQLTKDSDINIDFSSLAPYDMTGWGEFAMAMWEGGFSQALLNSPAGQLLKSDGRVQNAVKSLSRWFGMTPPIEETPEDFLSVANELASISSGWSNGMKAYLALETGKRYDKYGSLIDNNTHPLEAIMEAFGFSDASRRDLYVASKKASASVKAHKEEVTQDVKVILDYVSKNLEGKGPREIEMLQRTTAYALSKYKDDPVAQEIFHQQLIFRLRDANEGLLYNLLKASGIPEAKETKDAIRMSSLPEDQKSKLLERIEDMEKLREGK